MRSISSGGSRVAAALIGIAMLGLLSDASRAATRLAAAAATPSKTVTATRITRRPGTLAPGSPVRPADVSGQRVFIDAEHGFALASVSGADYSVATGNRGKTWKTDGPALHLDAAQAPLAVVFSGAVDRRTLVAWGGGQVIDTTGNGGRAWYSTLFTNGSPIAVVHDLRGRLLAFVGSFGGSSVWQYVSSDGGRTWHYRTTVGG